MGLLAYIGLESLIRGTASGRFSWLLGHYFGSLEFLNKEGLHVFEFCCAGAVWKNSGARSIYLYCSVKRPRPIRKPGSAYGINFHLILYCFECRKHDAFLPVIGADSKCVVNPVRRTIRL